MVGNEMSLSSPVSRRKLSSAATASISVSFPRAASRSNQARKRVTAAPSRTWAARAPAISTSFFTAFMSAIGSAPRVNLPPWLVTRRPSASAAVRELVGGGFAGEAQIVQRDGAERRGRAVGPDGVDQIGLERDQRGPGGGTGLAQPLRAFGRVQPGIVAQAVAGGEIRLDPAI